MAHLRSILDRKQLKIKIMKMLKSTKLLALYEKYMMIMGPATNAMFYVQAYKIFSTKQAQALSLPAFLISLIGIISYLWYGIFLKNKVLILANVIGLLGVMIVIIGIVLYR